MKKIENWTRREIIISVLENKFRLEVDDCDRSKYRAYIVHKYKVFVGKAGAFRVGDCASKSFSVLPVDKIMKNKSLSVYEKINQLTEYLEYELHGLM